MRTTVSLIESVIGLGQDGGDYNGRARGVALEAVDRVRRHASGWCLTGWAVTESAAWLGDPIGDMSALPTRRCRQRCDWMPTRCQEDGTDSNQPITVIVDVDTHKRLQVAVS